MHGYTNEADSYDMTPFFLLRYLACENFSFPKELHEFFCFPIMKVLAQRSGPIRASSQEKGDDLEGMTIFGSHYNPFPFSIMLVEHFFSHLIAFSYQYRLLVCITIARQQDNGASVYRPTRQPTMIE